MGLSGLVEAFYPERCAWCGAMRGEKAWMPAGRIVSGLRRWDRPHVCLECSDRLRLLPPVCAVLAGGLAVWSGTDTNAELVRVVAEWKYHGIRGHAWAFHILLGKAYKLCTQGSLAQAVLVPVPLHRRRQRERGFNQAAILAALLAADAGCKMDLSILQRPTNTPQQAKIANPEQRTANVKAAFSIRGIPTAPQKVWLVDDLVTTGATACAAADALSAASVEVLGVLCLGLAKGCAG